MSKKPELDANELDPRIRELFEHYREGSIGPDEIVELFNALNHMKEDRGKAWKPSEFRAMLTQLGYTEFDFKKIDSEWYRWRKREARKPNTDMEGPTPPSAYSLHSKTKEVTEGATKALLAELQKLGNLLITEYAAKASQRGEGLTEYVLKCIELREQYGDQIEGLQQENDQLKALTSILVQVTKPTFRQMAVMRMYLEWTQGLLELKALNIPVSQEYVDHVTGRLEMAMGIKM